MADPDVAVELGEVVLEVREGDLTQADTAAVANAANNHLWMGGGVAGAIKRAGGPSIEAEAVAQGPIPVGTAVATSAGSLPFQAVIHGAVMGQDLRTSGDLITRTTRACLELAEERALPSLALPAFGTGVGGFPLEECARLMAQATADFARRAPAHLHRVVFTVYGPAAYQAFAAALQSLPVEVTA
jgi:O-acetyl-ADP-ribose deacetylase (regulator of RNase III)